MAKNASIHILIVDDHAVVRRGVREMLAEEFSDAVFGDAKTAQEALERAWKVPWDLIILDITMPGRSGLDILKDLKAALPATPVLVQSMHAEAHFAMRVLKGGAAGYLTKESVADELIRAARKVLAGGRYISESLAERLAGVFAADAGRPPHELLSDREFQVLRKLATGESLKEIGAELSLSIKTISTYRTRILAKLELRTNQDLTQFAMREGVIE